MKEEPIDILSEYKKEKVYHLSIIEIKNSFMKRHDTTFKEKLTRKNLNFRIKIGIEQRNFTSYKNIIAYFEIKSLML